MVCPSGSADQLAVAAGIAAIAPVECLDDAIDLAAGNDEGWRSAALRGGSLVTGREHDRCIRTTRWPRSEPAAGLFNVSGPSCGRSEVPQSIGHSRDLTVGYMDPAMFGRRQRRHDGFLCCG
jgi:hypothetical protein